MNKTLNHDKDAMYYLLVFNIPFTPILQEDNKLFNTTK